MKIIKRSLREVFSDKDDILKERLNLLLPNLMKECDLESWIVIGDEYNEGPVVKSLLPSSFFHARRKSVFLFICTEDNYKCFSITKPDFSIGKFYIPALLRPEGLDIEMFYSTFAKGYNLEEIRQMKEENTWECIERLLNEYKPKNIGVNFSKVTPFGDGISKNNYGLLTDNLSEKNKKKILSGEDLAIRWLETRTKKEIKIMETLSQNTKNIIKKCYSKEVITPGVTTIGDARFHLMDEAIKNGMYPWFDATMWIRRKGNSHLEDDNEVIQEGDLLHCDFGVEQGGLCSDIQEMAYIKTGSDDKIVEELERVHLEAMKLQDLTIKNFSLDRCGNGVLASTLEEARGCGIKKPMIYSHPIGIYGHGPGPTIGLFSNQKFVEGMGERLLKKDTCYALELNVRSTIPSWNNLEILYGQETVIHFDGDKVSYLGERQKKIHFI